MSHVSTQPRRADRIQQATDRIKRHVEDLIEQMSLGRSEQLVRYLEFCARFHRYSFRNLVLAMSQFPAMTHVAGIGKWNSMKRRVRAGQKGIMILAPMTIRNEKRDEARIEAGQLTERTQTEAMTIFKPVYVFDITQTEGEEVPGLIGATGDVTRSLPALEKVVTDSGIELVTVEAIPGSQGAEGASFNGKIMLRQDLKPAERFRVLAHELAHERLHWAGERATHVVRETEADAAAFVVCRHFGVECDTRDYLLLHHSDPQTVLARMENIRRTAAEIIDQIELLQYAAAQRSTA